jgi:hypothetical protein
MTAVKKDMRSVLVRTPSADQADRLDRAGESVGHPNVFGIGRETFPFAVYVLL